MFTGGDAWQDSGPGGIEASGIGAPSPSVHLGRLGWSEVDSPKVGRGAKGQTPIVCGWDSGGFTGFSKTEEWMPRLYPLLRSSLLELFSIFFLI